MERYAAVKISSEAFLKMKKAVKRLLDPKEDDDYLYMVIAVNEEGTTLSFENESFGVIAAECAELIDFGNGNENIFIDEFPPVRPTLEAWTAYATEKYIKYEYSPKLNKVMNTILYQALRALGYHPGWKLSVDGDQVFCRGKVVGFDRWGWCNGPLELPVLDQADLPTTILYLTKELPLVNASTRMFKPWEIFVDCNIENSRNSRQN